jgi:carboxylesterase type B
MRATNGIPLGSPLLLPVGTVNCVAAIMESGSCSSPIFFTSPERAKTFGNEVAEKVGCDPTAPRQELLECMRNVPFPKFFMHDDWHGARFRQKFTLDDAIGSHATHSSRVSNHLTMNSVTTLVASHTTEGPSQSPAPTTRSSPHSPQSCRTDLCTVLFHC